MGYPQLNQQIAGPGTRIPYEAFVEKPENESKVAQKIKYLSETTKELESALNILAGRLDTVRIHTPVNPKTDEKCPKPIESPLETDIAVITISLTDIISNIRYLTDTIRL